DRSRGEWVVRDRLSPAPRVDSLCWIQPWGLHPRLYASARCRGLQKRSIDNMPKYIFVTGGVVSSLGKGLAASSIGALLEARGLHVTLIKLDPYLNVDPGTMSPFQHGEVFVTDDGAETDLDL